MLKRLIGKTITKVLAGKSLDDYATENMNVFYEVYVVSQLGTNGPDF